MLAYKEKSSACTKTNWNFSHKDDSTYITIKHGQQVGGVKGTLPKVAALYRWEYGYLVFPVLSSTLYYSVVLSIFLMVKESERFLYVATILSQNSQL